jgi:hypothetical protein
MEKRAAGQETIFDFTTGKYYHFDHRNGEEKLCNVKGDPVPKFLHGISGFADTSERRRRQCAPSVQVLNEEPKLPKMLRLPAKYCGYATMPRPGIHITAGAASAYKLPPYLQPQAQKLGRVSTRAARKVATGDPWNSSKPSFIGTLGSQFDEAMRMGDFLPESEAMRTEIDVAAVTARNKQVVLDEKGTLEIAMEKLRAQRTKTSGRFGSRAPPFNPGEMKYEIEERHDRIVNPTKWAKTDDDWVQEEKKVKQRQRDRYLQFFVEKEEQEARMARTEAALNKQAEEQAQASLAAEAAAQAQAATA